jgi:hypothetical protein
MLAQRKKSVATCRDFEFHFRLKPGAYVSFCVSVYLRALLCSNGRGGGGGRGKLFEDSANLWALIQLQRYSILQIVLLHRVNLHLHRRGLHPVAVDFTDPSNVKKCTALLHLRR